MPDILSYFADLVRQKNLCSIDTLLIQASIFVNRYASQDAHDQALFCVESRDAPGAMKVPIRLPFTTQIAVHISEGDPPIPPTEDLPNVHQEASNFDGDCVLANSFFSLQDFGWWNKITYAIPEGDIGRVFKILKVRQSLFIYF